MSASLRSKMQSSTSLSNLLHATAHDGTILRTAVCEVRIQMKDVSLWDSSPKQATNWFTAEVADGERTWPKVAVRLQGQSTRRPPGHHPSLTLKFNQEIPGENFHGMTKVHLRNAAYNPTYLNEYLGYGVFRRAGLPAPRVEFARVSVNGQPAELYVLVEGISKNFLEREFGHRDGNLYEGEHADVDGPLHQGNGERESGAQDLRPLLAALHNPAVTNGLAELRKVLNVEQCARFMAGEILVGHRDGYCLETNNYRLYHNPADDRFAFLPHGLDALFANPYARLMTPMTGLVARAILASPEGRQLYVGALREVLDRGFRTEDWTADLVAGCQAVQPALEKISPAALARQRQQAEFLFRRLRARHQAAEAQVRELEQFLKLNLPLMPQWPARNRDRSSVISRQSPVKQTSPP